VNLSADHLADLRASGLSEDTITALGFQAVRPADIPVREAHSAYRIPYFNLDGSLNCFHRLKLVPPVKNKDGHTQKYWQQPGTAPGLYLPPLSLQWASIAKESRIEVVIVEGEKKAAAGCQQGLIAAGVGGAWSGFVRSENGKRLVLPLLNEFIWDDRPVLMCPDSDAWRPDKEMNILAGFFALAKELQHHGASVRFVVLPELPGRKCGLDDWLLIPGNSIEQMWPALERIPLTHERFLSVTACWQSLKEKEATQEAIRKQAALNLEVTETAGVYTVGSQQHRVRFVFDHLTDSHRGVSAELSVTCGEVELLSCMNVGLKSDNSQSQLCRSLLKLAPAIPWKVLLQKACSLVLKQYRRGEPIVTLEPTESTHVPFLLNPLIFKDCQTLIYAPGGSCKSYLALFLALVAAQGAHLAGLHGLKTPVLYLDWELNERIVGGRLRALQNGHPNLANVRLYYRRCENPLHLDAYHIAAEVAAKGIKLLIIDSAAMACGGDLASPDAAIRLQQVLRKIGCASLVLAHVSKGTQEGQEKSAYGTVFFRELARNVYELQKADGENPTRVFLSHTKHNFSAKQDPLGFALTFSEHSVRVDSCDVMGEPQFQDKLPVPARIRNLLEDGKPRESETVAEELNIKLSTAKSALSRGKAQGKWMMIKRENGSLQWTVLNPK
jgi:hypothetical protein